MSKSSPWWARLYARQHAIWPGWSAGDGGATAVAEWLHDAVCAGRAGRALDLGCGVGRELVALGVRGWSGRGVDLAPSLIDAARQRAHAADLHPRVAFEVGDLTTASVPAGAVDLLLIWDCVLAIWSPAEQAALIRRWAPALAPGGRLVVGQLNRSWWVGNTPIAFEIADASVGPGRTERRYTFDPMTDRLIDAVTFHPPEGGPERLPDQTLALLPATALVEAFVAAGLSAVQVAGNPGGRWSMGLSPPGPDTRQIAVIGRG